MIKDITLGQYFPGNSAIHRLDPRTKLLGMIAYIVIVFLVTKTPVFIIPALFAAICIYLARVPFGYVIRSLKPIRFLLVFMFIVNLFMVHGQNRNRLLDNKHYGRGHKAERVYNAQARAAACRHKPYDADHNADCAYGRAGAAAYAAEHNPLSRA